MEKATFSICLPRPMKDCIGQKLQEGRFTPEAYITRSIVRDDRDRNGRGDLVAISLRLRNEDAPRVQNARAGARWTRAV